MHIRLRLFGLIIQTTAFATAMSAAVVAACGAKACAVTPAARLSPANSVTGDAAGASSYRLRFARSSDAARVHFRRNIHHSGGSPASRPLLRRSTKRERAHASKTEHNHRVMRFATIEQAARHLADDRMLGAYIELNRRRNEYESLRRQVPRLYAAGQRAEAARKRHEAARVVGAVSAKKRLARYAGVLAGALKPRNMSELRQTAEGIVEGLEREGVDLAALGARARAGKRLPTKGAASAWHGAVEALVLAAEAEEAAGRMSWLSAHAGADAVWFSPIRGPLSPIPRHVRFPVPNSRIRASTFSIRLLLPHQSLQ
jgi:hypothetical protein